MGKKSKKAYKKLLKAQMAQGNGAQAGMGQAQGWLGKLQGNNTQQLLLGAAIGAAAVYVLSNDELREKIVRSAVRLYSDINGGVAELKEQMADMQAELQAQGGEQNE